MSPELVVEVLSQSTEAKDRGAKWRSYQRIESLEHYLLIATDARRIEHYHRTPQGWLLRSLESGRLELADGVALGLDEVYRLTPLAE